MKQHLLGLAGALALAATAATAQTQPGVGIGTTAPDASAALDIVSSSKGALLPRVADATAIASPATGLLVFQTGGTAGFYYNAGTPTAPSWQQIATAAGAAITASNGLSKVGQDVRLGGTLSQATDVALNGQNLTLSGSGKLGLGTTTPEAGRLTISPTAAEPKITLYNGAATVNYYGLGISSFQQNYHVGSNAGSHVFYAGGTNGDGTELLRIRNSGYVGIGTSTPNERLDVAGNTNVTGNSYVGGRLGLGTNGPGGRLHAVNDGGGGGAIDDYLIDEYGTGDQALYLRRANGTQAAPANLASGDHIGALYFVPRYNGTLGYNGSALRSHYTGDGTTFLTDLRLITSGLERLRVDGTGQVGIGTTTPTALLDLGGTAGVLPTDAATRKLAVYNNGSGTDFYGLGVSNNYLHLFANTAVGGAPKLSVFNNGNVGVGSAFTVASPPTRRLDVDGDLRVRGLTTAGVVTTDANGNLGSAAATTAFGNDFIQNQNSADQAASFRIGGNGTLGGRLGVGTTAPGATLDVRGDLNVSNTAGSFQLFQFPAAANTVLMGAFSGLNDNGPQLRFAGSGAAGSFMDIGQSGAGGFVVEGNDQPRLTVQNGGRVGIGVSTPAAMLDLQGGADANGGNDPGALAIGWRAGGYRHFLRTRHNGGLGAGGNDLDFYLNNSNTAEGSSAAGTGNTHVLTLENNGGQARLGLGTTSPGGRVHIVNDNGGGGSHDDYIIDEYGSGDQGLYFRHGNGTQAASTPLNDGDFIGQVAFVPQIAGGLGFQGSRLASSYRGDGTTLRTDLQFVTSGTDRLRLLPDGGLWMLNTNGNVLLTTATPTPTGGNNVVLGNGAGQVLGNGNNNILLGTEAGKGLSGQQNVLIGGATGAVASTAERNVLLGYASGNQTTGNRNTLLGYAAGQNTAAGQNNVALGHAAGFNNTTGSSNTFLGADTNPTAGNLSNATAVGYGAVVSQSNTVVLGNGASVGIGTSTPRGRLDVRGGDTYLVENPDLGTGQSVYLPGHLLLAPYSGSTGSTYIQARVPSPTSSTNLGLVFRTTSAGNLIEPLNLNANGNVSVNYTLQLSAADADKIYLTGAGAAGSKIGHGTGWGVLNYAGPGTTAAEGYHTWLTTAASAYQEQMRLTGTGLGLGLNGANPSTRLHVGGTAGTPNVRLESLGGTGSRMVTADAQGNLSTQALPVAATGADFVQNQTGSAQSGGFNVSGSGTVGGGLTVTGASAITGNLNLNATGGGVTNINVGGSGNVNLGGSGTISIGAGGPVVINAGSGNTTVGSGSGTTTIGGGTNSGVVTIGRPANTTVVNGPLRVGASGTAGQVLTPTTGTHNMLALAYGQLGNNPLNTYSTSGNYSVVRTGAGVYTITFPASSGLNTTNFDNAPVVVALYGSTPGFITWTGGTGSIVVNTFNVSGTATDRIFTFTAFAP